MRTVQIGELPIVLWHSPPDSSPPQNKKFLPDLHPISESVSSQFFRNGLFRPRGQFPAALTGHCGESGGLWLTASGARRLWFFFLSQFFWGHEQILPYLHQISNKPRILSLPSFPRVACSDREVGSGWFRAALTGHRGDSARRQILIRGLWSTWGQAKKNWFVSLKKMVGEKKFPSWNSIGAKVPKCASVMLFFRSFGVTKGRLRVLSFVLWCQAQQSLMCRSTHHRLKYGRVGKMN